MTDKHLEEFTQNYSTGLRFTSDSMDCSLPIAMDSHSGCSFGCLYCFSNNLMRAPDRNRKVQRRIVREKSICTEYPIRRLERFLNREENSAFSRAAYPLLDDGVPMQLGALGDPFDNLELQSGWAKQAIPLFIKHQVPVRVGTKGGELLQRSDYLRLFESSPDQFWFAWSIICNDDDLIGKIDIGAPTASARLAAMKLLTDLGCNCSIRFRPFLPGVSDAYPGEPEAWKKLIYRAREAGARAISFEFIFLSRTLTKRQKNMYRVLFRNMGNPMFGKEWRKMSHGSESCLRATRSYKYDMTMKIREYVHSLGMTFGCSDPHFKEFNDTGSCCGMPERGNRWFSNWSRRQLTEVIVQAKRAFDDGNPRQFSYLDWASIWSHQIHGAGYMYNAGNWHSHNIRKNETWGDRLRNVWNNPKHPRNPYMYFEKVLCPVGVDKNTGDLVYEYRPWRSKLRVGKTT